MGAEVVSLLRAAGAVVVVADLEPYVSALDGPAVAMDVTSTQSVNEGVVSAQRLLGTTIDILVNSAGISGECTFIEMSDEAWSRSIDINLTGAMRTCRAVLPGMIEQRWGRIINVASQLGIKGAVDMSHYVAGKAGLIGFTKALAQEVAPSNVLVNAIAPGPFYTKMLAGASDEWKARKMSELPLMRFGVPAEVAPTVLLLASDPGGNLYVGQTLGPNSGDVMP